MTAQYGRHEAKAVNLLAQFADHIEYARPSDQQHIQHATAHFLGQAVEELQQHRTDSQTATEELTRVLDDGLSSIVDAINRLADAMEPRRSWWQRRTHRPSRQHTALEDTLHAADERAAAGQRVNDRQGGAW